MIVHNDFLGLRKNMARGAREWKLAVWFESEIWISNSRIPPKGGPLNDTNGVDGVMEMTWGVKGWTKNSWLVSVWRWEWKRRSHVMMDIWCKWWTYELHTGINYTATGCILLAYEESKCTFYQMSPGVTLNSDNWWIGFVTERGGVNQLPMPILKFLFNKTYVNN